MMTHTKVTVVFEEFCIFAAVGVNIRRLSTLDLSGGDEYISSIIFEGTNAKFRTASNESF